MRTIFTNEDVKNIIVKIFEQNSEEIDIVDGDGEKRRVDLKDYLNIKFYTWKHRLASYEDWMDSIEFSINSSYALVEITNTMVLPSQDIDSATVDGSIIAIVQTDKAALLDYYVNKIRSSFLGAPQDIQNSFGEIIKAYINIGIVLYEGEPSTSQLGECITARINFSISYLTDALTYSDTPMEISFDGGTYYEVPYTKATIALTTVGEAVPRIMSPNTTGVINTSASMSKVFSLYDFNQQLTNQLNEIFFSTSAFSIDGDPKTETDVNLGAFIKITCNGHTYIYYDVITGITKDFSNGDFTTTQITFKGAGR